MKRSPISLWDQSAVESDVSRPMSADVVAEVAIVGAGFTGLSTALHLALRGVSSCVIEANHVGFGASGRNAGLVNAGLWLPPQEVRTSLGDVRGTELIRVLGEAPEYVFSVIDRFGIQCEATRTGTIHAAHSPKGFQELATRAEEWHRLGAPVDLLDRDQASRKIGTNSFYGGLLDHRAGTINPMGYARGLARAAQQHGAQIYSGVRAIRLEPNEGGWRVHTTHGMVTARRVVLGTNAYTDGLWPGLRDIYTQIYYFQVATVPLGARAETILPEGQGLWDTNPIMFSLRRDQFGRLLIGSMGKVIGGEFGLSKRWAARMLARLFPDLGPVKFETAWHGQIDMTTDHLPHIYRLAQGLYTSIGYNGRGITPGTMFGRAFGELLSGGEEAGLPLPVTNMEPDVFRKIKSQLYQCAFTANQIIKSL
ncbi:FAD-binding oxidoreductase [Caballeronia sp. GACF5]|uniref:NAD(P)/FAD-dependent oxidoreductase n=1 Tax=Caballeronia sp. GACF5 TaxID=2921746 RepID=UPI002028F36A|nr:FAD-binding oxidoreductase [Caballeronia sp. GACF5]